MSLAEFTAAVRAQLSAVGGKRISPRTATAVHAAAAAPGGIEAEQSKTPSPSGPTE
jgi:hypothetical protein